MANTAHKTYCDDYRYYSYKNYGGPSQTAVVESVTIQRKDNICRISFDHYRTVYTYRGKCNLSREWFSDFTAITLKNCFYLFKTFHKSQCRQPMSQYFESIMNCNFFHYLFMQYILCSNRHFSNVKVKTSIFLSKQYNSRTVFKQFSSRQGKVLRKVLRMQRDIETVEETAEVIQLDRH